jgi:phosphopantothenate---cysteine ligase (CTP)
MNCLVTAGGTYEKLDKVRRLTNFSTGRLGTELAGFLAEHGHSVTLLLSEQAVQPDKRPGQEVETFSTSADLRDRLQAHASSSVDAVFHAAAVSDFTFGKVWSRSARGELTEIKSGKISTRQGTLLAELVPAPKIIAGLRDWFPQARLVGWKYEVDGDRAAATAAAEKQIRECLSDACVANGPAYGTGFGFVTRNGKPRHLPGIARLLDVLEKMLR